MSDRITPRQLNRTGLARQLLLERVQLEATSALERVVGLQSQDLPAPFLGLWSRLADFQREALLAPIRSGRVVKSTLMRATLHVVTRPDFDRIRPAIQPALDRSLRSSFGRRLEGCDVAGVLAYAHGLLAVQPRTFAQLRPLLASFSPGCDVDAFAHLVRMSLPMVVIPAEAPWGFPGNPTFTLADVPEAMESPEDRLRTLVRRYLAAFGPARPRDMQHWSGLTGVREVFDGLRSELRRYRDEARSMALQAAREKANAMAKELGVEVGPVRAIRERSEPRGIPMMANAFAFQQQAGPAGDPDPARWRPQRRLRCQEGRRNPGPAPASSSCDASSPESPLDRGPQPRSWPHRAATANSSFLTCLTLPLRPTSQLLREAASSC